MAQTVLVLAAHPDDETLGCGGTIARLAREGHAVTVAILSHGLASRRQSHRLTEEMWERVERTAAQAMNNLGATLHPMGLLPDNAFDTVPMLDIVKTIESLIEQYRPDAVYTQAGGDLNIDHQILYRAALTATRPVPGSPVREVYAYEVASSTEWSFQQFAPAFQPNVFVDISDTMDLKIQAMEFYESERRTFPHPRSPEALRAQAGRWGAVAGLPAAEAFQLVRAIR